MASWSPASPLVSSISLIQVYRIQVMEGCSIFCPSGEEVKCTCPFWEDVIPNNPAGCNGDYCTVAGSCDPVPDFCTPSEYKYNAATLFP
jgi:hypothetical protein